MVRVSTGFVRNGQIVIQHPDAAGKPKPRALGGQVIMQTRGLKNAQQQIKTAPRSIKTALEVTANERAQRLQSTLQQALAAEYSKSGTGRFARGIRVSVTTSASGSKSRTHLQIKAMTYRETKFLTNLGGIGRFKQFPVAPYRIYAKGAQVLADIFTSRTKGRTLAKAINKLGGGKISRLKVPRSGNIISAGRQPGRGGGEQRFIRASGPQPPWAKTQFFYPLWVNHPGFRRDLLSELAISEGSQYMQDVVFGVAETVPSGRIPISGATQVKVVTLRSGTVGNINQRLVKETLPSLSSSIE